MVADPLSISHISSSTEGVACTFNGIDHGVTTISGSGSVDVGPPQTQIQGACRVGTVPPSHPILPHPLGGEVLITFIGAANAQFNQRFPTDGVNTPICEYSAIIPTWEHPNRYVSQPFKYFSHYVEHCGCPMHIQWKRSQCYQSAWRRDRRCGPSSDPIVW